ncbi:MAG: hypothetical protein WBJ41_18645 [Chromatiaceae bacterium]
MPNFISEDEIEVAMLQRLQLLHGYDALICFTADPADLKDGSGRTDKGEVILRDRLRAAVIDLNPDIPGSAIDMPSVSCPMPSRPGSIRTTN